MTAADLRLRISTPTEPIPPGRGFYQLEEDALYVQVGLFSASRHFYSFLECDSVRFDLDRNGRLIFIEVAVARRRWPVVPPLVAPPIVEPADIRWLDFRSEIPPPTLATNRKRTMLRLAFADRLPARAYYLAEDVVAQVDQHDRLAAIWIVDITDDLAGQEIGAFRKHFRADESFFS